MVFGTAYGSNYRFSLNERNTWETNSRGWRSAHDVRGKAVQGAQRQQTRVNAEDAQADGEILEFNIDRMKLVADHVTKHPKVQSILTELEGVYQGDVTVKEVQDKCLLGILLPNTSKHPDAVVNCKVGNLLDGVQASNGCWTLKVREHKTFKTRGSATVTFMEHHYKGCMGYLNAFQDPEKREAYPTVFHFNITG